MYQDSVLPSKIDHFLPVSRTDCDEMLSDPFQRKGFGKVSILKTRFHALSQEENCLASGSENIPPKLDVDKPAFHDLLALTETKEYTAFSTALLESILTHPRLSGKSAQLWQILYSKARFDSELKVCVSVEHLAELLLKSLRQTQRYISLLESLGFLLVEYNFREKSRGQLSNTFYIRVPEELLNSIMKRPDRRQKSVSRGLKQSVDQEYQALQDHSADLGMSSELNPKEAKISQNRSFNDQKLPANVPRGTFTEALVCEQALKAPPITLATKRATGGAASPNKLRNPNLESSANPEFDDLASGVSASPPVRGEGDRAVIPNSNIHLHLSKNIKNINNKEPQLVVFDFLKKERKEEKGSQKIGRRILEKLTQPRVGSTQATRPAESWGKQDQVSAAKTAESAESTETLKTAEEIFVLTKKLERARKDLAEFVAKTTVFHQECTKDPSKFTYDQRLEMQKKQADIENFIRKTELKIAELEKEKRKVNKVQDATWIMNLPGERLLSHSDFQYLQNQLDGLRVRGIIASEPQKQNQILHEIIYEVRFGSLKTRAADQKPMGIYHGMHVALKLVREGRWATPAGLNALMQSL